VITTYYLVEGLFILEEAEEPGVKSPVNVQLDIEHYSGAEKKESDGNRTPE
jgi:hypothetical protein